MLSRCSRLQYASQNLLALKEEFDRVYPLACASNDVGLAKKLVEEFERELHAYRIEFIGKYYSVEIGRMTKEELVTALKNAGYRISDNARRMLRSTEFTIAENPEQIELVCLTVDDLFQDGRMHATDEIYKKAEELGLELCPAEVGPYLRFTYLNPGEWMCIAMKQIVGPNRERNVFSIGYIGTVLWLSSSRAKPDDDWSPLVRFVFRLRPATDS